MKILHLDIDRKLNKKIVPYVNHIFKYGLNSPPAAKTLGIEV